MPGLQHDVIAAAHRQPLTGRQHMVIQVAAAGDPERPGAGHDPGLPWGHPALHIVHQYLFHESSCS
jgi:hypothetical protein